MSRKKGIILFFCIYGALTALILAAIFCMLNPLRQKLADYEAAQLDHQCARIFDELFAEPDWETIYILSGAEDTLYEGASAYAAYMEAKAGDAELTFEEVYTDLPDTHKYAVYLEEEKIAAFTLTSGTDSPANNPQWTLDEVAIFFERNESVIVEKKPEHTVYINGVALDDSFTIRSVATKAESYLPEGVHGYRLEQQRVDGLLTEPEVLVLDENGKAMTVTPDPQTGIYTLQSSAAEEMTEEMKALVKNAALADAKFAMGTISEGEFQQYFDSRTQLYTAIIANPIFVQKHKSSSIDEAAIEVGEYCRYSDELFSANVKLTVEYVRKDDTIKEYRLDKTYFFSRSSGGNYLVSGYTNEAVQETVEQVRMTFVTDEENRTSLLVSTDAGAVSVPEVIIPEGKELVGWATKTENGNAVTMTVRLLPDGTILGNPEPMELYPVFQAIPAEY